MKNIGRLTIAGVIAGLALAASAAPTLAMTKSECEFDGGGTWTHVGGWGWGCARRLHSKYDAGWGLIIIRQSDGASFHLDHGKIGTRIKGAAIEGPPGSRSYPYGHKPPR